MKKAYSPPSVETLLLQCQGGLLIQTSYIPVGGYGKPKSFDLGFTEEDSDSDAPDYTEE